MKFALSLIVAVACLASIALAADSKPTPLEALLQNTKPLDKPRGPRLPFYVFTAEYPNVADDAELERVITEVDARGLGLLARWSSGKFEVSCALAIRIAKIEKKLGIPVAVLAENDIVNGFFDGTPETAHKDADGKPLFDNSFLWKCGCPYTLPARYPKIKAKLEPFLKKYKESGALLDLWTADFEFDGPDEWNTSWATSKKCVVCGEKIKDLATDFTAFQTAVRTIRTELQNECFSKPIKEYFPDAKFGVYGMNPNDGYRYWWDFFEKQGLIDGVAYKKDQGAVYRPWAKEFDASGYTAAMPVIYSLYNPYTFKNGEYGWFYNMLLEYSACSKNTPDNVALLPYVHWSITAPKDKTPLSQEKYEDLLWHLLLRRANSMLMWCDGSQMAKAIVPLQKVYAESLQYSDFIEKGRPVTFEVPAQPGTVVSALKLGNKLLVRRTDFESSSEPVELTVDGKKVKVSASSGGCQLIDLP